MTVAQIHPIYQLEISSDFLNELKEDFRTAIKSRRRESTINHISELINILWKRNIIRRQTCQSILLHRFKSEAERAILQNYIDRLDYFDRYEFDENFNGKIIVFVNLLNRFLFPLSFMFEYFFHTDNNQTPLKQCHQKIQETTTSIPKQHSKAKTEATKYQQSNESLKQFQQQKAKIYNHIANEMEWQWKDLGRELELSESTLVNFESKFNKDIKSITHQILLNAEEKFQDEIVVRLCEALKNARRGDLAKFVKRTLNIL